jgi:predicted KAP-like P-loop ATPase
MPRPEEESQSRALKMLADTPIAGDEEDRIGFTAYADAFALLINDEQTATPLTIAISGPWGSGKTSLARLIEERVGVEQYWIRHWQGPPIVCWFNAWLDDDAPHLGAALAAEVARNVAAGGH